MDNDHRRVLYHPQFVLGFANALREAKDDLREMHERHVAELADLRREVAELRDIMQTVTRCARENAERDVASLRRQLETQLARLERDPKRPLH